MNKTRVLTLLPLALAAILLSACGASAEENSAAVLTQAAQIFADSLTQTAAVAPPTATATPVPPTATNTPLPPTNTPTITGTPPTATPSPTQQQVSGGGTGGSRTGCVRAELGYETIPDGTKIEINENFKKIWTFKNVGTCSWTQGFSLVWQQGETFGTKGTIPFSEFTDVEILPGEHLTIEVQMQAPDKAGTYKGYWLLRSDAGVLFGLGPDGRAWFWVEIQAKD
ncbi:MAG: NBR1-Ig-like domain-containing protein [Chloroflexi bacterium]|nr:NBR1-Ig-like domain-containing protein [Chloroflexota bacterium]